MLRIKFSPEDVLNQGSYNEVSDHKIASLTEAEILDTINNRNVSQIFMKDFNFKDLLGDVQYNFKGEIIGKHVLNMFSNIEPLKL
jgi:hypothetical protein